ncbi:MAG: hypothetical protein L6R39_005180, partial [Caloplaca ligustica]
MRHGSGVDSNDNNDTPTNATNAPYQFPDIASDIADLPASLPASAEAVVTYTILSTADNRYALASSPSGSLYLAPITTNDEPTPGTSFAAEDSVVLSDASDRLLHIYAPEIAAHGVSRLRVAPFEHMPQTARLMGLAPIDHDDDPATPSVSVAIDTL